MSTHEMVEDARRIVGPPGLPVQRFDNRQLQREEA